MNKHDYIYITIIFLLCLFLRNGCEKSDTFEKMLRASTDTLHKTRNKLHQEITTTTLLYGNIEDFKKIHFADSSAIGKLQQLVNKFTISATYLSDVTGNSVSLATQTVIMHDTIFKDGIKYLYPEYQDSISNRWEKFKIRASKDSIHLDYKVFNEFDLKQEWKNNGLFKRKTPEVTILNLNPHTETLELKTFTVKEDKTNRLRDMLIGAAMAVITVEATRVFNVRIPIVFK